MALEEGLKQRLIGAAVLVALVVIFVPMLIDEPQDSKLVSDHRIPEKPPALVKPMPEILPPKPETAETPVQVPEAPPTPKPDVVEKKAPSKKAGKKPPTSWMIQVASLTVQKNAEKLVADLRKAEMPAHLEKVAVDGKKHFRIRVGPEVDFKTAERMAKKIKRDFKLTPKVMRYPE
ncbi:MAG: SPOR domain-containing protein [Candidatus Thiodiazotropha sp. (ex Monitilora ramsayi)]|nr:SPOR domain-containing protein [Candidatus Thiodiazotropha sp. (ex Monitilora ramsayi)]